MKCKCYAFNGYEQRNKVCFVYLECNLQQNRYGRCIFKLRYHKKVERAYSETRKYKPDPTDLFRCDSAHGKVTSAFLDSANKQARCSLSI